MVATIIDSLRRAKESSKALSSTEEFTPAIDWSENPISQILSIDLPGFNKDDIKVQVDGSGRLTVRGRRMGTENKYQRVEQVFQVPENTDIDRINGKLDEGRLTLTLPKKSGVEGDVHEDRSNKKSGLLNHRKTAEEEEEEVEEEIRNFFRMKKEEINNGDMSMMDSLLDKLQRNKNVIAVAALAFTVGFCVSKKFLRSYD
ncbi:hypothetical protein ZOSMA_20G00290 [Zostera marina]|uniref:SHSP domain-containing protein n=1 Tax=Zostera marina TaxID=29655 RepID=A0A0K9PKQ5_ZOSMR|nr:hypothetical protein ZOSMA_20G00290 [Zostera marina]